MTDLEVQHSCLQLVDVMASRPFDASSSHVRGLFPSGHESFNGEIGQRRLAVLSVCIRHIVETGDGELSLFLGDCLQHLPQCSAYIDKLIEVESAIVHGDLPQGSRLCIRPLSLEGLDPDRLYSVVHPDPSQQEAVMVPHQQGA